MDSCKDCTHFRQHYVLSAGVYVPLNYGHCVARRRKKLQADSECCEHFMRVETVSYTHLTLPTTSRV